MDARVKRVFIISAHLILPSGLLNKLNVLLSKDIAVLDRRQENEVLHARH